MERSTQHEHIRSRQRAGCVVPGPSWRWVDPRCCLSSRCLSWSLPASSCRRTPAASASQRCWPAQRSAETHTWRLSPTAWNGFIAAVWIGSHIHRRPTLSYILLRSRGTTGNTVGFSVFRSSGSWRMSPWKKPILAPCANMHPCHTKMTRGKWYPT